MYKRWRIQLVKEVGYISTVHLHEQAQSLSLLLKLFFLFFFYFGYIRESIKNVDDYKEF